ncbi:MAG: hypothetical protein MH204_02965 [Fimbriimonadaceae bacterium]|nr:hypothetical protein [Fimbriimonadaceae bacterium]
MSAPQEEVRPVSFEDLLGSREDSVEIVLADGSVRRLVFRWNPNGMTQERVDEVHSSAGKPGDDDWMGRWLLYFLESWCLGELSAETMRRVPIQAQGKMIALIQEATRPNPPTATTSSAG